MSDIPVVASSAAPSGTARGVELAVNVTDTYVRLPDNSAFRCEECDSLAVLAHVQKIGFFSKARSWCAEHTPFLFVRPTLSQGATAVAPPQAETK
jgi:hypothetical protein